MRLLCLHFILLPIVLLEVTSREVDGVHLGGLVFTSLCTRRVVKEQPPGYFRSGSWKRAVSSDHYCALKSAAGDSLSYRTIRKFSSVSLTLK